jgi:RsiW-degrading membrane proteinase PrsW (M82 family)
MLAGDVRDDPSRHSVLGYAWYAFIIVALSEEGTKFLLLRWYAYPKQSFNEPFDGIVFAVMIGMGFATVENIEYVRQFGLETGISRFFLAVPAHGSFAVLMGYHVGWAKFEPERSAWLMWKGLAIVVGLHGSFDFFLFLQQNRAVTQYVSTGILSFGAFASFYIAVRMAMRAIRMHQALEEEGELSGEGDKDIDQNTNFDQ